MNEHEHVQSEHSCIFIPELEIKIKILGSDICLPIESCLRIKSDQETPFDLLLEMGFVSSYVTTIDVEIFSVIGNMLRFIHYTNVFINIY